jgi:rhodanese-related sulfurtransferase
MLGFFRKNEISVDEYIKVKDLVVTIDVRELTELAVEKIPNAQHIPMSHFVIPEELDRSQKLVTVCAHGIRSQRARALLMAAGFTDVTSLKGGLAALKYYLGR